MKHLLLILILLTTAAFAKPDLSDKEVLLVVSMERQDRNGEWLELTLRGFRHDLGLTTEDLPVVRMGLADEDTKAAYFEKLDLNEEKLPAVCLVKWSAEEKDGPDHILDDLVLTQAKTEEGLNGPRELFADWLKRTGKENLVELLYPPAREVELPEPAQVAFEERRYEDAIQLAREDELPEIEAKAKDEFQKQAALALAEDRRETALSVYQKLADFYPEDEFYRSKVEELNRKTADLMVGKWKIRSSSGWIEFTASEDGSLEGKGALYLLPIPGKMRGHWLLTGENERTFQLHWKNGALHNIKLHESGDSFEGKGVSDGNVTGNRIK